MHPASWIIKPACNRLLASIVMIVLGVRLLMAVQAGSGWQWLSGMSLQLLFPALLAIMVLRSPPTLSAEGSLLKVACALHFILMLCFPFFSLHLLLGFPVVFLLVEFMCTVMPEQRLDVLMNALLRKSAV